MGAKDNVMKAKERYNAETKRKRDGHKTRDGPNSGDLSRKWLVMTIKFRGGTSLVKQTFSQQGEPHGGMVGRATR